MIVFTVLFGKFGDVIVDSFREVYISQQILSGKVLYKDIFVIYPPLAYLINAILIKIFHNSLNTLYFAGLFCSFGIIYFTYKLGCYFLEKKYSYGICLFLISSLILSPNVFNSFLPYSFGIIYGILFSLISAYYIFNKKYPLAYLFCSLALLCKYEFLILFPILLFCSKKDKILKNLSAFFIPIIFVFSFLFYQGLSINDLIFSFSLTISMGKAKTLQYFYSAMGLNFRFEHLIIYAINLLKILLSLGLVYLFSKAKLLNKSYKIILSRFFITIALFILLSAPKYQEILVYLFPLILILFIINFKKLQKNEQFFIILTLLVSAKVFFALVLESYGVYFLPLALISLFILSPQKIKKYLLTTLIIFSISIGIQNINKLQKKNISKLNNVIEYIKTNTNKDDKVVIYPEFLSINVLSNRMSDNKFYSLIPLYVEVFGEDLIIKRLEFTKPKYIILTNSDMSAYGFKYFGIDYAQKVQKWIENSYSLKDILQNDLEFKIYELN